MPYSLINTRHVVLRMYFYTLRGNCHTNLHQLLQITASAAAQYHKYILLTHKTVYASSVRLYSVELKEYKAN